MAGKESTAAQMKAVSLEPSPANLILDLEKSHRFGEDSSFADGCIVDFEGDDDKENPLNWTKKRRWFLTILVSFMTTIMYVRVLVALTVPYSHASG